MVKNLLVMQETRVRSLGWEHPLENGMAIHSSILAWRIPWTEKSGGLQFMGSQRVRHNWATEQQQQYIHRGFPGGASCKQPACQCRRLNETLVRSLGWEDPLDKGMATYSRILVWRIPWTEKSGGLQSIGLQRVRPCLVTEWQPSRETV